MSDKPLSERMREEPVRAGHRRVPESLITEVSALEQRVAALVEGQDSLKAQTVRIRVALGGSTQDNPGGRGGDTEDLAREVMARVADLESKLQRALAEPTYQEMARHIGDIPAFIASRKAEILKEGK